jgi:hypothetical protein
MKPNALLAGAFTMALLALAAPSHATDATDTARAQLSGQRSAAAPGGSTAQDPRTATDKARALLTGEPTIPATSARGIDNGTGTLTAADRARALLGEKVASGDRTANDRPAGPVQQASRRCETNNRGWCGVVGL